MKGNPAIQVVTPSDLPKISNIPAPGAPQTQNGDLQVAVRKAAVWSPWTEEDIADAESLRVGFDNLLDPMRPTPPPPPAPGPNPNYVHLLEVARATSPALTELVELHEPKAGTVLLDGSVPYWVCSAESDGDGGREQWPTETDVLIARVLGVELEAYL